MSRSPFVVRSCLLLGTVLIAITAPGQTYYVATDGNDDTGDGSLNQPWESVERALSVLHDSQIDGATVLVRPGTYNGRQNLVGNFTQGVTVRSEIPYQAQLRNSSRVVVAIGNSRGASGITLEGFDIAHTGAGAGALVVHVDGGGGNQNIDNLTFRNNIFHDSYNNDLLKINNGTTDILVENNMFYNQTGSDEHIDINSVENVTVRDNLFFNDFAGSGRTNPNNTSSYIVIKDSNDDDDIFVGNDQITVQRNAFFNWEGSTGGNFVLIGEDAKPYIEARNVMVENNLMLGNSENTMRAAFGVKSGENVTFRNNTVSGDLPALAYAMRVNVENPLVTNDNIRFFNNIWSDPTGTMGARGGAGASDNDFSDSPPGEVTNWELTSNVYWNGDNDIPSSQSEAINFTDDTSRTLGDPQLADPSNLIIPRWLPDQNQFADGSSTIREAFVNFVTQYAALGPSSAALDNALPEQAPVDDILGTLRGAGPDRGAWEASSALLGDYNGNGVVDSADYAAWLAELGGTTLTNDSTAGSVDLSDYDLWKSAIGESSGAGSFGEDAAVPEPTPLSMTLLLMTTIAASRTRIWLPIDAA